MITKAEETLSSENGNKVIYSTTIHFETNATLNYDTNRVTTDKGQKTDLFYKSLAIDIICVFY